jgi:predicted enzyme related to lactoylglutathione lyase
MDRHEKIDYVEFAARDLEATKSFFGEVFGWAFTDYGPDYCDSSGGGIMVGFFRGEAESTQATGGALVTFYSVALEETQAKVEAAGATIVRPIFAFPGGRRFQFQEPSGNEFAVWSDR